MNDIGTEDTGYPPYEPDISISCSLCECVENLDAATNVYRAEYICLECYNEIFFGERSTIEECFFCHEDSFHRILTTDRTVYMCVTCFGNLGIDAVQTLPPVV